MKESQITGYPNGSMGMFVLLSLIFVGSFKVGFRANLRNYKVNIGATLSRNSQTLVISLASVAILFIISLAILKYSIPSLLGVSRTTYFKSIPSYINYLKPTIYLLVFLSAYQFFILGKSKVGLFFTSTFVLLIYFFLGEKFTGFISALTGIIIIYASSKKNHIIISFKIISAGCIILIALIALIILQYGWSAHALKLLSERIALQAQVGWIFFNQPFSWISGTHSSVPLNDMSGHIEYLYTPYDFYLNHYMEGYGLTGFYPAAYALKYGMFITLIFSSFFGVLLGSIARFCWTQLTEKRMFVSLILFGTYNQVYSLSFSASTPGAIGSIFIIASLFVYIFTMYGSNSNRPA